MLPSSGFVSTRLVGVTGLPSSCFASWILLLGVLCCVIVVVLVEGGRAGLGLDGPFQL